MLEKGVQGSRGLVLVLGVVAVSLGCPADEPTPPVPPPDAEELPGRYVAQAVGSISLAGDGVESTHADGRLQARYVVFPDDRVVVTHLAARLADVDLVIPFLWWEVDREPLRCTGLTTLRSAVGSLAGGEIELPANALRLGGASYSARKDHVTCGGELRGLVADNPSPAQMSHDPAGNSFGFSGTFAASHEGDDFTVSLDLDGDFVNRPPVARLAHGAVGLDDAELADGCPDPKSVANHPTGLRLRLASRSEDPDPHAYTESSLKLPRADLQREDWVRSVAGEFAFIREGREVEEVVFEPDLEHVLVLTVTDHSGARARKICEFFVAPQPG